MGKYFDPAKLYELEQKAREEIKDLEGLLEYQMGHMYDLDKHMKCEDHPNPRAYPGYAGYVQVNVSAPYLRKGHFSFDVPYDENGRFSEKIYKHKL